MHWARINMLIRILVSWLKSFAPWIHLGNKDWLLLNKLGNTKLWRMPLIKKSDAPVWWPHLTLVKKNEALDIRSYSKWEPPPAVTVGARLLTSSSELSWPDSSEFSINYLPAWRYFCPRAEACRYTIWSYSLTDPWACGSKNQAEPPRRTMSE